MLLDQRSVSRKTPLDGKLEISPAAAERLASIGTEFSMVSGGCEGRARLQSMACTCVRGKGEAHVHHFIESPLLTALAPGTEVRVELEEHEIIVREAR